MRPDVHRRSVRRRSRNEERPRYVIGIDFGLTKNYTALAMLECVQRPADHSASTNQNPIITSAILSILRLARIRRRLSV
jgi:hypothetical protein